jgi:hypothetical protein
MTFIEAMLEDTDNILKYPTIKNPTLDGILDLPLGERIHMLHSFLDSEDFFLPGQCYTHLLELKSELEFLEVAIESGTKDQKRVQKAWTDLVKQTRDKQLSQLI